MTPLQEIDKECLENAIENLIIYTNEVKQLEERISYKKSAIIQHAQENGQLYSDSSHSVSLVYTPNVEWQDEEIESCDLHIKDFEQQIEVLKHKQQKVKEMRKARISELQEEAKSKCVFVERGINQIWQSFDFIKSLEDKFQVCISKSKVNKETGKQESDFERSWIYKK